MSRDQRVRDNHALLAAQAHALAQKMPLAVAFCLYDKVGFRAREHYEFMLDGLRYVEADLARRNIPFMMFFGDPVERMKWFAHHVQPDAVYADFNPLKEPSAFRASLAEVLDVPVYEVDAHNIVPVWAASDKLEVGARTLRPKIHRKLADYMQEPSEVQIHPYPWPGVVMPLDSLADRIEQVVERLPRNGVTSTMPSGETAALAALEDFVSNRLPGYATARNDPSRAATSGLSPYLHFGQLSSLRAVLRVYEALALDQSLQADADALVEEMVVRKELSDNFCYYSADYLTLSASPAWAQVTLAKHATDPRPSLYDRTEFEVAKTHDPAWNAAQRQLTTTGKMHGYMRMYWAKKVLEWSATPQEAIDTLVYLNDFYSLDGGDPNGYVGILWSVAGLHDRPWGERAIYGTVRSMVYDGLKRKFDISEYIRQNS